MNPASTSFVLGYHGCAAGVADRVIRGRSTLVASANDYDWLGHGIYFWEYSALRAYEFASEVRMRPHHRRQRVRKPAVVGAIIDLGYCLNMLDSRYIETVQQAYVALSKLYEAASEPLPANVGGDDRLQRRLDCTVIEMLNTTRESRNKQPFDTVRAAFVEGKPIYENAGFHQKTHIQLCVRNPRAIKGYFRLLDDDGNPLVFPA